MTASPAMSRFFSSVARWREAAGLVFAGFWGWVLLIFIAGLFIAFGATAMNDQKYFIAEALYFCGVGLVVARIIYKHWANNLRKEIGVIVVLVGLVVLGGLVGWTEWKRSHEVTPNIHRPAPTYGELYPDTVKTPPECLEWVGKSRKGVIVFLGNVGFYTDKTMIPIMTGDDEFLSVTRSDSGGINIAARVISFDNKLVAQITQNKFATNPPESFTLDQKDLSTLILKDLEGHTLLYVHYLNKQAIEIKGRFYSTGGTLILADESGLHVGGVTWFGGCLADSPKGIVLTP